MTEMFFWEGIWRSGSKPNRLYQLQRRTTQLYSVFLSLSAKTNDLMSHLQLATARQLGLYSQAGDVFSSGIYSPHCCPARKTSSHSRTTRAPHHKLNKENVSVRSKASRPCKRIISGKCVRQIKATGLDSCRQNFQLYGERWQEETKKSETSSVVWPLNADVFPADSLQCDFDSKWV